MITVQLAKELRVYSAADGSANGFALPLLPQARDNKIISILVFVHEVDGDTRIRFAWGHGTKFSVELGPGDILPWAVETSMLFESGDSTGISTGMKSSSSTTDISRVDVLVAMVECLKITAGSGQKKATISAWAVMKPL